MENLRDNNLLPPELMLNILQNTDSESSKFILKKTNINLSECIDSNQILYTKLYIDILPINNSFNNYKYKYVKEINLSTDMLFDLNIFPNLSIISMTNVKQKFLPYTNRILDKIYLRNSNSYFLNGTLSNELYLSFSSRQNISLISHITTFLYIDNSLIMNLVMPNLKTLISKNSTGILNFIINNNKLEHISYVNFGDDANPNTFKNISNLKYLEFISDCYTIYLNKNKNLKKIVMDTYYVKFCRSLPNYSVLEIEICIDMKNENEERTKEMIKQIKYCYPNSIISFKNDERKSFSLFSS